MSTAKHLNQQQFSAFKEKPAATGQHSVPDMDAHEWGALMGHIATSAPGEPLSDLGPSQAISGPMPARPQPTASHQAAAGTHVDRYEDLSPSEIAHRRSNKLQNIHEDYTSPDYKPLL